MVFQFSYRVTEIYSNNMVIKREIHSNPMHGGRAEKPYKPRVLKEIKSIINPFLYKFFLLYNHILSGNQVPADIFKQAWIVFVLISFFSCQF